MTDFLSFFTHNTLLFSDKLLGVFLIYGHKKYKYRLETRENWKGTNKDGERYLENNRESASENREGTICREERKEDIKHIVTLKACM